MECVINDVLGPVLGITVIIGMLLIFFHALASTEECIGDYTSRAKIVERRHMDGSVSYGIRINYLFGLPLFWVWAKKPMGYFNFVLRGFGSKKEADEALEELKRERAKRMGSRVISVRSV